MKIEKTRDYEKLIRSSERCRVIDHIRTQRKHFEENLQTDPFNDYWQHGVDILKGLEKFLLMGEAPAPARLPDDGK